jgi:hypothetical protein
MQNNVLIKWLHESFDMDGSITLIFKQLGWYLNFSTYEVLLEHEKVKL